MSKVKSKSKSSISKKKIYKRVSSPKRVKNESRTISFVVGILTVLIVAAAAFFFLQGNNYKSVLGSQNQVNYAK